MGVGVCGVSAIIGAAGSIDSKKGETGYAIAVILVFGAWAELAVDNTTEAVATGAIYSKAALAYTTLAKLCRNALIEFVIWDSPFTTPGADLPRRSRARGFSSGRNSPKFNLGFLALSVLSSILFAALRSADGRAFLAGRTNTLNNLSEWEFQLTFVEVGLRTSFQGTVRAGLSPTTLRRAEEIPAR